MTRLQKLSCWATGFACVAAVVMPFAPLWLFLGLLVPSLVLQAIGLVFINRLWQDVQEADDLYDKWREQRMRVR